MTKITLINIYIFCPHQYLIWPAVFRLMPRLFPRAPCDDHVDDHVRSSFLRTSDQFELQRQKRRHGQPKSSCERASGSKNGDNNCHHICCYHYRCVSYLLLSLLLDRVFPLQAVSPPCQAVSPPFLLGCQPVLVPPSRLVQAHEHDQVAQAIAWHTQRLLQRRAGLAGI